MCGSKTKTNAVEPSSTGSTPRSTPTRSRSSQTRSIRNTESSGTNSHSAFSFRTAQSTFPSKSSQKPRLRVFKFSELKEATMNFSSSLMIDDDGGYGCVYRGTIKTSDPNTKLDVAVKQMGRGRLVGTIKRSNPNPKHDVAVKQMGRGRLVGHKEWVTEINVLGVVEHPNLVKLLGYCVEDDERGIQRLLIYEYMPNRSVEDHLSSKCFTPLPWTIRLSIALDAARGLTYLHEEMDFQIIFRDFKSSNILLDDLWYAKLSGFGMARLGPSEGLTHVSTTVVGTIGYAAPEYIQTGRPTSKTDVWSYGVFLYELIAGRFPIDRNGPKSGQRLLDWIRSYLSDTKKFEMILDPRLKGNYSLKSALKLSNVANQCLVPNPKARPKMSDVLEMVKQIVEVTMWEP